MKLKRAKLHGDAAWLWIAPNGTEFYLQKCYGSSKWVWCRSERDVVSSEMYNSLQDLKDHLSDGRIIQPIELAGRV